MYPLIFPFAILGFSPYSIILNLPESAIDLFTELTDNH